MVASMPAIPTRLAMKLGESLARTTPLPRLLVTKASSRPDSLGLGGGGVDQLHQRHVAGWVEEVDAAESAA
jgi:hypothetical protein